MLGMSLNARTVCFARTGQDYFSSAPTFAFAWHRDDPSLAIKTSDAVCDGVHTCSAREVDPSRLLSIEAVEQARHQVLGVLAMQYRSNTVTVLRGREVVLSLKPNQSIDLLDNRVHKSGMLDDTRWPFSA